MGNQLETCLKLHNVTIDEYLQQAMQYQAWLNLSNKDGGVGDMLKKHGVKRQSALYDLPY